MMSARRQAEVKLQRVLLPAVESLERGVTVAERWGSRVEQGPLVELALQRVRVDQMIWALGASDAEVDAARVVQEAALSEDERAAKYGACAGLDGDALRRVALVEDLEIVLGLHPGQGGA